MEYKLNTKKPHTIILIKLISLASLGAVLFTPGIPEIVKYFHISEGSAQSALTLFLVGYAIGQLFYSPFANRFGRKPTLYGGLLIAIIGSLGSALAGPLDSFPLLLISRLITAIGASVGLVLTLTIINDFYHEHQARQVVPIVSTAFSIVPFIGIAIGGVLVHNFGWTSSFYFLFLYYIAALFFASRLPETGTNLEKSATRPSVILAKYLDAIKDKRLVTFSILFGITTAMIYIFAASAPLIAIDLLKISPQDYGFVNLLVALFYLLGSLCAAFFTKKFSAIKMIKVGLIIFGSGFLGFFVLFMLNIINPYSFFIPFMIAYFGFPIAFSNVIVLASNHYKDQATGAAMMNFINMTGAVIGVFIIQNLPGPLTVSLPYFMVILVLAYVAIFIYAKRFVR